MLHSEQCGSCVGVCDLSEVGSSYQLQLAICSQFQLVRRVVRHGVVYFRATCISICHPSEIQIC
jgi:hypothetical protein